MFPSHASRLFAEPKRETVGPILIPIAKLKRKDASLPQQAPQPSTMCGVVSVKVEIETEYDDLDESSSTHLMQQWLPNRSIKFEKLNASPPQVQQDQLVDPSSIWVKGNNLDIEICVENKATTIKQEKNDDTDDVIIEESEPHEAYTVTSSPDPLTCVETNYSEPTNKPLEGLLRYIVQKDDKFYCKLCDRHFFKRQYAESHVKYHDVTYKQQRSIAATYKPITDTSSYITQKGEKYFCNLCDREFSRRQYAESHVQSHNNKKKQSYVCNFCNKDCKSKSPLDRHLRTHTGERPYKCDKCQATFTTEFVHKRHIALNKCKALKVFDCPDCDKVFTKADLYNSHRIKHTTDKPFVCDICGDSFKYRSTIVKHVRMHSGELPFPCPHCDKAYLHKGLLATHMRVHTGEKPYSCPICNKTFSLKHNAKKHIKYTHVREKVLECFICHKVFPRESRLKYHMASHAKLKPFSCDICDIKFSHKQGVLRHIVSKHPGTIDVDDYKRDKSKSVGKAAASQADTGME